MTPPDLPRRQALQQRLDGLLLLRSELRPGHARDLSVFLAEPLERWIEAELEERMSLLLALSAALGEEEPCERR